MDYESTNTVNISDLIAHGHSMLEHAEENEWETVVKDEAMHRQLIITYFSEPSNITKEPDIGRAIRELLLINEKLEKLTSQARDKARTEATSISSGRKAVNAYAENSR